VKLLLDTQCWLWMNTAPERFSLKTKRLLLASSTRRLLSVASIWEIGIKYELGKLPLPEQPSNDVPLRLAATVTSSVAISLDHAFRASRLPSWHRDPFGRMSIAQALVEGCPLLSSDPQFSRYQVKLLLPLG